MELTLCLVLVLVLAVDAPYGLLLLDRQLLNDSRMKWPAGLRSGPDDCPPPTSTEGSEHMSASSGLAPRAVSSLLGSAVKTSPLALMRLSQEREGTPPDPKESARPAAGHSHHQPACSPEGPPRHHPDKIFAVGRLPRRAMVGLPASSGPSSLIGPLPIDLTKRIYTRTWC